VAIYVTDTHPLVWFSAETYRKLSPGALRIFQKAARAEALIWVPAMVLWEAGLLEKMRRVQFKPSFREWADALIAQPGFALAPLDEATVDAALAIQVPLDVFDAGIVATARAKDLPLITRDQLITKSKAAEILW
jgi:PIN domain nuclease of toxin-antitoxin system